MRYNVHITTSRTATYVSKSQLYPSVQQYLKSMLPVFHSRYSTLDAYQNNTAHWHRLVRWHSSIYNIAVRVVRSRNCYSGNRIQQMKNKTGWQQIDLPIGKEPITHTMTQRPGLAMSHSELPLNYTHITAVSHRSYFHCSWSCKNEVLFH